MKKGFILFTALFLISTFTAFAAVKAVKEGDVVKVTWTYENADAASVGLVGDFQAWNLAGALPMTKDANGVWTITLDGKADSEYKYKFNVDGEWTEDPTAPASVDDGFGGLNGVAIVADLLAAASGAPAPSASAAKFTFSNYSSVRIAAYSKGAANDKLGVDFRVKSYWKILDAKLWESISLKKLELAVDNEHFTILDTEKNTDQFAVDSLLGYLVTPFNSNGARSPYAGHWSVAVDTPVGEIGTYYNYAKPAGHKKYYYDVITPLDGLSGMTQIGKDGMEVAEGVKIDYMVGLGSSLRRQVKDGVFTPVWSVPGIAPAGGNWYTQMTGFWGHKSYLDVSVADQMFGLMVNSASGVNAKDNLLKEYFKDASYEVAVGATGKAGDLSYKFNLVNHFYDGIDYKFSQHKALGTQITYKMGGLKLLAEFQDRGAGMLEEVFFTNTGEGDNTIADFTGGKSGIALDVTYADDMIGAGIENDITLESFFLETAPAVKETYVDSKIYGSYNISSDIKAGAHVYVGYKTKSDDSVKGAVNFKGFGLYSILKNMGLPKITAGVRVAMDNGHDDVANNDVMNISALAQADLPDAMGLALGVGLLGGEGNSAKNDKFGLGLSFNKKFDGKAFAGPQFFTAFNLNMNINDSWDEKYELELSDDYYIDGGRVSGISKYWNFAAGFKWDF